MKAKLLGLILVIGMMCPSLLGLSTNRVAIVVNEHLYPMIEGSVKRHMEDLRAEGYVVELKAWSLVKQPDPEALKGYLRELYLSEGGLQGALFVGDLPVVMFEPTEENHAMGKEYVHQETFLTDTFYMDLVGERWEDSNGNGIYDRPVFKAGQREQLEIWVSRLKASSLSCLSPLKEWDLINEYFQKNHDYRVGKTEYPEWNLMYIQDDHAEERKRLNERDYYTSFNLEYTIPILRGTAVNEFLHLQDGAAYEYVTWVIHGMPKYMVFDKCSYNHLPSWNYQNMSTCAPNCGYITSHYLSGVDVTLGGLFTVPCSCWIGKYTENNYFMGSYLFKRQSQTLSMISATIPIIDYSQEGLIEEMGKGVNFGLSYLKLANEDGYTSVRSLLIGRSKVLFGDGTLKRQKFMNGRQVGAKKLGSEGLFLKKELRERITPVVEIKFDLGKKLASWPELKIAGTGYRLYRSGVEDDQAPKLVYEGKERAFLDKEMKEMDYYWLEYFWDDGVHSLRSEFSWKAKKPYYGLYFLSGCEGEELLDELELLSDTELIDFIKESLN